MVFESVLSSVLNKFLGAYVENLDANQLKVGIWGGDVELKNLVLKQSALDDLDLPVQTVYGRIGKLVLKIPWSNLYGAAFVINIEDIYLLAEPNQQVKYDQEKELAKQWEAKQKEILKVELAKKQDSEKDKIKTDFTFTEKLITQIIKNIHLNIKNIHIRYEDKVTSPAPFALGVTLAELDVLSTDEFWKPAITKEDITKIYKIVKLEGLASYWNCKSACYDELPRVDLIDKLLREISSKNNQPANYKYVLGPINASARLRINQRPEIDTPAFSIPKVHLNLDMEKLFVGISKAQYRDIIALADSMNRMTKGLPYRKYRPNLQTYKGHFKEWWHFAYTCVLEQEVRRKRRNWNWDHICAYKQQCKEYGVLYEKNITNKSAAIEKKLIEDLERQIDTFNIVIIRQRIEFENERRVKKNELKTGGWFSWWGSSSKSSLDTSESGEIRKQFQEALSKEEKDRLYKAIGYQENAAPSQFPEAYVDNSCTFVLRTLEVELIDENDQVQRVILTDLKGVQVRLDTRAAANAIMVNVKINEFITFGKQQDTFTPSLITSDTGGGDKGLLEFFFETNPLDKSCGQRLHVTSQPLKVVYDAQTIIKVVDIFKIPPSTALDQLSAAADTGLNNIKEMSSTGLQYAIDAHVHMDLKIDFQAPYIIIPYGGIYTENENVIVINLGNINMRSIDRPLAKDLRKMHAEGIHETEIRNQLLVQSYDRFEVELNRVQIMIAQSDEDWKKQLKESTSTEMHLLQPVSLKINLAKCMFSDDPKLPLMQISGELPSLVVDVSDARLLLLMALVSSIPLPDSDVPQSKPLAKNMKKPSSMMLAYKELQDKAKKTKQLLSKDVNEDEFVQFTTLEIHFVMSELALNLKHQEGVNSPSTNVASFYTKSLEFDLTQQTFNTNIVLRLAALGLVQHFNDKTIDIVSSPAFDAGEKYLFQVKFIQVNKKSAEFHSTYKSCEASLTLEFAKLGVVLHQEGLLSLIQFATILQKDIEDSWGNKSLDRVASTYSSDLKRTLSSISEEFSIAKPAHAKKIPIVVETIKFKLVANLDELCVEFTKEKERLSSWALRGIHSDIIIKESYTQINAKLDQIAIIDLNPDTIHNLILTFVEEEAISACVVLYNNDATVETDKYDLSVELTMGRLRIIFLNWFVTRMSDFVNEFEAARTAVIDASQAAAKSAKENVQNVYAKATKISFRIDLKAPDIIVPENSKSLNAILIDLGLVSMSNEFLTLDITNDQNFHAVVDEMKLNLTDLKISRLKLNSKNEIDKELNLLKPVTFKLVAKRNLSSAWYTAIPEIDIVGRIFSIEMCVSQWDYKTILSVLNGNLAEGQSKQGRVQAKPTETKEVIEVKADVSSSDKASVKIATKQSSENQEAKVSSFLRLTFTMDNLVLSLFTGGSKLLSDAPAHDDANNLARFSLEGISVKLRILTDGVLIASFLLLNCLLDDMRKGREDKLNRLIQRSQELSSSSFSSLNTSTESLSTRSMIDVVVQIKQNHIFTDVKVYSFTLILSVDYLLKIADFLKIAEEPVKLSTVPQAKQTPAKVATQEQTQQITLNLKVEKPDIILVEHMDNTDTKAMILNSEIMMKLRLSGEHQVISGVIKDLQLYTCCYDPAKRADTRGNVLHPVTISLAGSTPQDNGLHLELVATDIRLGVSPATIELLSNVLATATGGDVDGTSEECGIIDYSDLWDIKPFQDQDFWFLKGVDEAFEATESLQVEFVQSPPQKINQEMCIISMPSIMVTLEAGVGNKTLPMLILESTLKGQLSNWSSQMSIESSLTLQMNYYNSRLALWEPLIEPVEVIRNNKTYILPWELKLDVTMNEREEVTTPSEGDSTEIPSQQPVMSIDVISESSMEVVVTKTCLEVLNNLGKAFATAMKPGEYKVQDIDAPYKIVNELGCSITVNLVKGSFSLHTDESTMEVILESGAAAGLQKKHVGPNVVSPVGTKIFTDTLQVNYFLNVRVDDKNCVLDLPVVRADRRFFPLNYRGESNDSWGIISDIKVDEGVTVVTVRSILQVYNHFNVPVEIYYMTNRGNELASITTVEPEKTVNIPLKAVYTPTNELFFAVAGYCVTTNPYIWKDLQTNLSVTKTLYCLPKDHENENETFVIQVVGQMEQVYYENTSKHTMTSTCYNIHLRPAVVFKNCLPIDIVCCVENLVAEIPVEPGKTLILPNVEPGKSCIVIRLPSYLEKEWSSRHELSENPSEFSVWIFNSYDSSVQMSLNLGMRVVNENGSVVMTLYCPFWMLNKTGLTLGYRKSKKTDKSDNKGTPSKNSDDATNILHHPANFKGPILFSFNAKNFFGKKKAAVRVEQGDWSDKFSLDVAGSSGVVVCKNDETLYQIGVDNQLTYNGLTKQITFMPYYVIINNASFTIECQENDRPADSWIIVEPEACTTLWPKSELDDKLLKLRVQGTNEVSAAFLYTESHTTLLKLKNKYGGINVDIQITEGAVYISLVPYSDGTAPALIINHTKDTMNFWEKETIQIRKLPPGNSILFTWSNPSGSRLLVWEGGNKKEHHNDLRKDYVGEYSVKENYNIFWVSFLDGMQRILLLTHDKNVAENAQAANLYEIIQQEITVSIYGLGLSLVNNVNRQEVMYLALASSGVIWETCKMNGRRFKPLSTKESAAMEATYQLYLLTVEQDDDAINKSIIMDSKTEIDFQLGVMIKPNKRKIRRTFQMGLWFQMKTSPSQLQLHAKINRLQIDNQMFDCIFPVVLAPVPIPKSVAIDSGIKPFAELSIVQLLIKNTQIKQYKYFKLLIQEFHIKVDLGFVNALVDLLATSKYSEEEEKQMFLKDMGLVEEPLYAHVSTQSLQEQKSFYDLLHFSPLKIHVSFSMTGGSDNPDLSTPNFINVLLQGLGVTLTDLQDVIFKLAYFEREYTFLTQKQLISEASSHYVGQAVKQLYVLVLGLDVLGNPYGLVRGITQGVEDLFYEPFQGAIQGPGEFAEGLVLGVRSLFGHTVGGAAGAVSRMTGALGKGLAALTFDKDYQKKRRDQINRKPATVQEGIARGGKGLVMGVFDGVTGVFTKPISGAKEEGFGGFLKGVGKGAVGLVTRPTAGVVDFASGSLDAVKRAAEFSEDTSRIRPPRFLQGDGLVRPYNIREAQGHKLLMELEKGKYATTDIYVCHYDIIQKKDILLLTDKRLAYITHNDIFGGWQVDWMYTWQDIKQPATVVPKGIAIAFSERKKKITFFGSGDSGKIILIADPAKREEICNKIESLRFEN